MKKDMHTPRFPLSRHFMRTHFSKAETFDEKVVSGCSPNLLKSIYSFDENYTGEGVKIAIISAYDNEAVEENLSVFSQTFGLAEPDISVYFDSAARTTSRNWLIESSLDTQWAHAFAPMSRLLCVFSESADVKSLLSASEYAAKELGADIVSMSFGTEETTADMELSGFFEDAGCIFVASSGDVGGRVSFPSTSPYCISVGGTKLTCNANGKRLEETAWNDGGGGKSGIFEIPLYQGRFFNIYGMADGMRGTPDVAMAANYTPGMPVYVSELGGWTTVGGTSLACACFAGICACIKQKHPEIKSSTDMLSFLYGKAGGDGYAFPQYSFYDITVGKSGDNYAGRGFDFASGLGSPVIRRLVI